MTARSLFDILPVELQRLICIFITHGDDGSSIRSFGLTCHHFYAICSEFYFYTIHLVARSPSNVRGLVSHLERSPSAERQVKALLISLKTPKTSNMAILQEFTDSFTRLFYLVARTLTSLAILVDDLEGHTPQYQSLISPVRSVCDSVGFSVLEEISMVIPKHDTRPAEAIYHSLPVDASVHVIGWTEAILSMPLFRRCRHVQMTFIPYGESGANEEDVYPASSTLYDCYDRAFLKLGGLTTPLEESSYWDHTIRFWSGDKRTDWANVEAHRAQRQRLTDTWGTEWRFLKFEDVRMTLESAVQEVIDGIHRYHRLS